MRKTIIILMIIALVATTVSCDNRDAGFDNYFSQDDEIANNTSPGSAENNETAEPVGVLDDTLTIWVQKYFDSELRVYAKMFQDAHPDINIKIETYEFSHGDTAKHLELVTSLLADPPDLLQYNSTAINFEKLYADSLFVNLYELFNGLRGIDIENYFSNIFHASELNGKLYGVPLFIDLMLAYPNIRLFEGAGIDISAISSVSIDDEIELYLQVAPYFPEETIYPSPRFSIWSVLTRNAIYDIDSGEVNANTPQMAEMLRKAMEIPVNDIYVKFSPEHIMNFVTSGGMQYIAPIMQSDVMFHDHLDGGMVNFSVLFLQEHQDIQLARPVPFTFGDADSIGFTSLHTLSIMKDSPNIDLAWEFMRFIMEYEESLHDNEDYLHSDYSFPINRKRFNNQVYDALEDLFIFTMLYADNKDYTTVPLEDLQKQQIEDAVEYIYSIMESLNYEYRQNRAVLYSLVYPDVWLLYSGQQTIEQSLANIQNRLELYVNE